MTHSTRFPNLFLLVAFTTDLLTPILISRGLIPDVVRWASHAAILAMVLLIPLRMLTFDHIPAAWWVIIAGSLVGISVAIYRGQGIPTTLWGWWLMFAYPFVGLFCYLQPSWPRSFPRTLLKLCIGILGFQVVIQLGQYLNGVQPGDALAGLFGERGTSSLVLFICLVFCFSLGEWLTSQRWIYLALTTCLGVVSSVLGEMKIFLPAMIALGCVALLIYVLRGKELWKFIPYGLALVLVIFVFVDVYDTVVPGASTSPIKRYITDPKALTSYLSISNRLVSGENYYVDIGRNSAIVYGWKQIAGDPIALLFGQGLGVRSESRSLGIVGTGLAEGSLGINAGTSMLVLMQEMGFVGLAVFAGFTVTVIAILYRSAKKEPGAEINSLRYGLILFSLLWPIWLWYALVLSFRVPMLLYWGTLGYVWSDSRRNHSLSNSPPINT
ncbi:MAG: hypothetical protein PHQ40_04260 [Anaerolineaceae bacterium]|nr:hypothetical protein [Anaerolineaceae bacterium]